MILTMLAEGLTKLSSFNPRSAISNVQSTLENDPDLVTSMFIWFVTGSVLYILGAFIFLFSEINACLIARDSDFRNRLISGGYMEKLDGDEYKKLLAKEEKRMAPRPYLTVLGVIILFFALSCLLYPLCELIAILGLPSAPCLLIITVGALFAAICNASFLLFLVWSCTRTWAALVFLFISLAGSVLLPSGNPILLMLWVVLSFALWYTYFYYLPAAYGDDKPMWLQDFGTYGLIESNPELDKNIQKFSSAFRTGADVIKEDIEEAVEAAKKKVEEAKAAAEKAAEQAKQAAEQATAKARAMAEETAAKAKAAADEAAAKAQAATGTGGGDKPAVA